MNPNPFRRYPFRRRDDLVRMQALLLATRPAEDLNKFPTPHDLDQLLEHPDIRSNTALWWSEGKLVAYAVVVDDQAHITALPEAEATLKAEILAWRKTLTRAKTELEVA